MFKNCKVICCIFMYILLCCIDRPSVFHNGFLCFRMPRQGLSNNMWYHARFPPSTLPTFGSEENSIKVWCFFLTSPYKNDFVHFMILRNSDEAKPPKLQKNNHWKMEVSNQKPNTPHPSPDQTIVVGSIAPRRPREKYEKTHTTYMALIWQRKPQLYDLSDVTKTVKRWKFRRIQRTESSLWQFFIKIHIQHRIVLDFLHFSNGMDQQPRLPLQKWQVGELAQQQENNIVPFTIGSL